MKQKISIKTQKVDTQFQGAGNAPKQPVVNDPLQKWPNLCTQKRITGLLLAITFIKDKQRPIVLERSKGFYS